MDIKQFEAACDKVIGTSRERNGIGTLGEKTVHAVLKNYIEPREEYHEIKVEGFFADIKNENGIIEIQTRSFNTLRKKLKVFLELGDVTIVYPIPAEKWLYWIDEETGELSKKRKSPKRGNHFMIFKELYRIKEYLTHPNLHLHIIMIDMDEYRLLNGWSSDRKKGSSRFDRIPKTLADEYKINDMLDYSMFIPDSLPETFTAKDYRKTIKLTLPYAQTGLHILNYVESVERIGKKGNAYIYQRKY